MTERFLGVMIEGQTVASLIENNGHWQMLYEDAWRQQGHPLSPQFPLSQTAYVDSGTWRPVQAFFDNLLPEEAARKLMASDANVDPEDHFALLAYYGMETAGALTLIDPEQSRAVESGEQLILPDALSARIQQLPKVALSHGSPKRMSLAGAQHKLPVIYRQGEIFDPVGITPSTHILKPDHQNRDVYPNTAANEWFVMTLAQRVLSDIPNVELTKVPESVYLITRFDRTRFKEQTRRRYMIDGCQALGLNSTSKYAQCTMESLLKLAEQCQKKAQTRMRLFEWLVFNYLAGNSDAHLKNVSFFYDSDGLEITPAYDLLCTSIYHGQRTGQWNEDQLVTPLGKTKEFGAITREDIMAVASELNVPKRKADELMNRWSTSLPTIANEILDTSIAKGRLDAGEIRTLRLIIHGPIMEACQRISR